jgi:DNA repair protein RecO
MGQSYILETYPKIRQDLECLSYAMGMLELVYFFFKEGESDSVFFDFLIDLFRQLDESQNYLIVFWFFLLKLCSYLGFKPDFERCFKCGKLITTNTVCFLVSEGSPACKSCNTNNTDIFVISKEEADFLQMLQSSNFRKISKIQKTQNIRSNIVQFLLNFLRYHTDEKLNLSSITFFKQQ